MKRKTIIIGAISIVAIAALAVGVYTIAAPSWSVPATLHYQGRLTDSAGSPVTGITDLTFRIWDSETGGTALWEEPQTINIPPSGYFSVVLGKTTGHEIGAGVLEGGRRWLGIEVGSTGELTPRQEIHSVPYALKAGESASLAVNADIEAATLRVGGVDVMTRLANLESRLATLEAGIPWSSITGKPEWPLPSGTIVRTQEFRWFGLPDDAVITINSLTWNTLGRVTSSNANSSTGFEDAQAGTIRRYRLRAYYGTLEACPSETLEFRIAANSWDSGPLPVATFTNVGSLFIYGGYTPSFLYHQHDIGTQWIPHVEARVRRDLCAPATAYIYSVDLLAEDIVP